MNQYSRFRRSQDHLIGLKEIALALNADYLTTCGHHEPLVSDSWVYRQKHRHSILTRCIQPSLLGLFLSEVLPFKVFIILSLTSWVIITGIFRHRRSVLFQCRLYSRSLTPTGFLHLINQPQHQPVENPFSRPLQAV